MVSMREAIVAHGPDGQAAVRRLKRIVADIDAVAPTPNHQHILQVCCGRAPYLATLLARDPNRLDRVAADPYLDREKPAEVIADQLREATAAVDDDDTALLAALRRYRADELVRLGVRELGSGNPFEVWQELSGLADASFDAAIAYHSARLDARYGSPLTDGGERVAFAVIGMGKLGGRELNFASDVDVIYAYATDNGGAGELSLHEYFSHLSRNVTAALNHKTADDVVFRVDLRLRPEGAQGAIANSLLSMERYYETFGRAWERQAWLKARACAGDRQLGADILDMLAPFIYPRSQSTNVVDDVSDLNRRIKIELDGGREIDSGFDVKNGRGGIREIEFFVQALQLIHAGRQPTLRSRTTVTALDQLLFSGLISQAEHTALSQAYVFLRRLEHVLQLDSGRQTQRLPSDAAAFDSIARRAGHADGGELRRELDRHTMAVAQLFATLGVEESVVPAQVTALLVAEGDAASDIERLRQLGFTDPERAQRDLERARNKPLSPFNRAAGGTAARVAPELLAEIAACPDPNLALKYISELISRRGTWSSMWALFDSNPTLMRLIISLFGTSVFLGKAFVNHPELIDVLLQSGQAQPQQSTETLRARVDSALALLPAGDEEARWNTLAEFKNAQVLRIGLADIAGVLEPDQICAELSNVAEVCLAVAYEMVRDAMRVRHGDCRDDGGELVTLAILGMGKLGGRELGYASDLDVIFVYSQDGESDGPRPLHNVTYMTRLAQRLINNLHAMHPGGRLYEIDTRLRPSGSRGLLVSSAAAWEAYHSGTARLWERQSLIKLRPVAGDPELGELVAAAADHYVYRYAPGEKDRLAAPEIADAVAAMRDEIERQLTEGRHTRDVKTGRGGLIDVEFAAQLLLLLHGPEHPALRVPSTVPALEQAARLGVCDPEVCAVLIEGYRFLRRVEQRMRIVHDRSVHRLPDDAHELDLLAHRVGFENGDALTNDYAVWTQRVRSAYEAVLSSAHGHQEGRQDLG